MKHAKPITKEFLCQCEKEYEDSQLCQALTCALSKTELEHGAFDGEAARKLDMTFSIDLGTTGVTAQKASGRCWIFAALNVLRKEVAENCNMAEMELSQNYIAFWDKFEKMNYFLESVIDSADLEVGDRVLDWILQGVSDGGQWDMIVSLIKKYGVVPKSAMPETCQSSSTRVMNRMLNQKLRKDAIELRKIAAAGQDPWPRKEEMLKELYKALCICFGKPVQVFDFEYRDKDKTYFCDRQLTPQSFYEKYVKLDLKDYVSIIHAPTKDKPYNKTYTVKYLGNVVEGSVCHLNVPMDTFKSLVVSQLQEGQPVWFGSDCSKYGDRKQGIWDQDTYRYGDILGGIDFEMTKEDGLDFGDSAMNHAMVIVGVNFDENGKPNRWKIENSWGDDAGVKGYFVMSDKWFEAYTYQAVVHKKYLSQELLKALNQEPVELKPWDPMGSLA